MTLWLLFSAAGCARIPQFIITHDPLSADEHIQLGIAYEEKKEWDHALNEYRKAVKINPRSMAYFYIGNAYCGKGEYSSGIESYRRALEFFPHHGDIYNNLAWAYLMENKVEEGSLAVRKALALDPENAIYRDTQKVLVDVLKGLRPVPEKALPERK